MLRPILRPKTSQLQQDQLKLASGTPTTQPIAMGSASPATLSGATPRLAGNVQPAPVSSVTPTRIPGFDGPRQPPSATAPAPGSLPGAPAAPAPVAQPGVAVPGTQNAGAPPPATTQDDIDQMIRDLVASQLSGAGKANTAEEEALIRQRMQGELGGSLVNQRARAGRAGFASSGALMAQEGDIKRAAEMDALDEILGLRRGEDQRSIDNAMGAIGAETSMRRAASDDALRRMALEALQAEMGLDAGPGPTDIGNAPDGDGTVIQPADKNGDGTVSVQEQQRYDQNTMDPYMAGSQKASDFFNGGGDASSLPSQPPGGDVIVLRQPRVDVDGNERPGVTYNTTTGALGRF